MKSVTPRMGLAALLPLLDTLEEGVVLHAEDGGVLACNAALRQMLHLGPTDLPGPEALLKSLAAF